MENKGIALPISLETLMVRSASRINSSSTVGIDDKVRLKEKHALLVNLIPSFRAYAAIFHINQKLAKKQHNNQILNFPISIKKKKKDQSCL